MNNVIFCTLGKDGRKGDRAKVLIYVLDRSLLGDRDDICKKLRKLRRPKNVAAFMARMTTTDNN